MKNRNGKLILLTALITLLPIVAGILLWDRLPEQIATHWNINGEADGWSPKALAVLGLPLLLTGIHLLGGVFTRLDPKSSTHSPKMMNIVLWLCPLISLFANGFVLTTALGYDLTFQITTLVALLLGGLFLYIGNYLPTCARNYTVGIKLPWTLDSDENWNATHRFGGWVWTIGGGLILVTSLWANMYLLCGTLAVMVLAPTVYSYLYYIRHR